jgi:hypothetical protein
MKTSLTILGMTLLLAALPLSAQETKEAPLPEIVQEPVGAGILSSLIREGEVSLGEKYDLMVGSRFHRAHTKFMGMNCKTCHAGIEFPKNIQFLRRDEYPFPLEAYPGAVDRSTCLGCHRGPEAMATPYYGVPAK